MKERIAGKINREELSLYSSIYSSYPFLTEVFILIGRKDKEYPSKP